MSVFARLLRLLLVAGLGLSLAACGARDRSYYPPQLTTPRDHPPPPKRRPVPPSWFLAEVARDAATPGASGIDYGRPSLATSIASRVPTSIEVQPLEAPAQREAVAVAVEQLVQRPVAAPNTAEAAQPQQSDGSYRVQPGDTLYAISRRFSVPIRAIIDANDLAAPYNLKVSDVLLLPRPRLHQVAKGETVYGISRVYGVEMSELVRQNNVTVPYAISTGQLLIIPSGKTAAQPFAGRGGTAAQPIETAAGTAPAPAAPPGAAEATGPSAAATAPRRAIAAIPKPPPLEGGKFLWPIEGKVLATFGPRKDGQHNDGINILAPRGAPVRAAENGVVAYAGEELRGFGRLLLIKHADGWVTAYAHNDSLLVQRGDKVRRGQPIAKVGSSGSVASPQLHFEVRKGSRAIDPKQLLQPSSISGAG